MSIIQHRRIILQSCSGFSNTSESKSIRKLNMICDDITLVECTLSELHKHIDFLKTGAIPVGSVKFVNTVMELLEIQLPQFYTLNCTDIPRHFYGRQISTVNKSDVIKLPGYFIKPIEIKQFSGFIYRGSDVENYHTEYEREQFQQFQQLSMDVKLFQSEIVDILAEWRCYIHRGILIKTCQYDDGVDDRVLCSTFIDSVLEYLKGETLALDIGLLSNGKYVIIELNDAYAIGKYKELSDDAYLDFISTRWNEIFYYGGYSI